MTTSPGPRAAEGEIRPGTRPAWASWLLGMVLLGAVVAVALHLSEARELGRLVERAQPRWLALAVLLQAVTYLAQAEVFRSVPRVGGFFLPRPWLWGLSLGKLFLDQTVPSAGMTSAVMAVRALEQRGLPRELARATAVVNIASYHIAYTLSLGAALGLASGQGRLGAPLLLVSLLFAAFSLAVVVGVLALSGRSSGGGTKLARLPLVRQASAFLATADGGRCRSPRVLGVATAWQLVIFLADAATMWVVLRSLGVIPPTGGVFVSFMVSSLLRTVGVVPGGLGTYEAASVATLRVVGVGSRDGARRHPGVPRPQLLASDACPGSGSRVASSPLRRTRAPSPREATTGPSPPRSWPSAWALGRKASRKRRRRPGSAPSAPTASAAGRRTRGCGCCSRSCAAPCSCS